MFRHMNHIVIVELLGYKPNDVKWTWNMDRAPSYKHIPNCIAPSETNKASLLQNTICKLLLFRNYFKLFV